MPIYSAQHLNLDYRTPEGTSRRVLTDISFSIEPGECIGILGKSGGGKTQLVLALARLNEYRGGEISSAFIQYTSAQGEVWDLKDKARLTAFRKSEIGYIFQEPFSYFNPTLKLSRQLNLPEENSGKKDPSFLQSWFSKVGLTDQDRILNSYPHQLSGGQLQRLAILACLIRNPRIVVADEITASLDKAASRLILDLLVELKKELGFTLLWVTHDKEEALRYCDRLWSVNAGKLITQQAQLDDSLHALILNNHRKHTKNQEEILKLSHLAKSYGSQQGVFDRSGPVHEVLKDVSLTVFRGEILGIVGPSGGGKSTLAKIIAGIERWDRGEIFFNSRKILPGAGLNKNIIYLFQDAFSSLNPQLSCRDLLNEALRAGENRADTTSLLALAQLDEHVLNKKAISLSGGLRQRFALARALAVYPEILIMDESINALDMGLQKQILDMLLRYLETTTLTIIFISHQVEAVRQFADRAVFLNDGIIDSLTT